MRLRSKKRIIICILLLIAICIEFVSFQLTKANNYEDITVSIIDNDSLLETEECVLSAANGDASGYYIVLPETLNNKVVNKYFVQISKVERVSFAVPANSNKEFATGEVTNEVSTEEMKTEEVFSENVIENEMQSEVQNTITNSAQNVVTNEVAESDVQKDVVSDNTVMDNIVENEVENTTIENTTIENTTTENVVENNIENNVVLENTVENNIENTIENSITENTVQDSVTSDFTNVATKIVELKPGAIVFLSEEELSAKKMELTVEYDKKTVNDQVLYNQIVTTTAEESTIKVSGYFPAGYEVTASIVDDINVVTEVGNSLDENSILMGIFSVKITKGEELFDCKAYGEKIKITLENTDTSKEYKVLEIDSSKIATVSENEPALMTASTMSLAAEPVALAANDGTTTDSSEEAITEVEDVQKEEDAISFATDSLDTYALLETTADEGISTLSIEEVVTSGVKWDGTIGTSFAAGDGSKEKPYLISEGKELAYLASEVNSGENFDGKYFQLVNDIDLNSKDWTPIGSYEEPFMGVFEGAGHSISNGKIETDSALGTNTNYTYGIFGAIQGNTITAEVKNIEFNNIQVNINAVAENKGVNVGIVSGTVFRKSKISNVLVKNGTIASAVDYTVSSNTVRLLVGGIAGTATNSPTEETDPGDGNRYAIENCYASVTIDTSSIEAATSGSYFTSYKNPNYVAQVSVGGIIGRIRSQNVWPANCLVETQINADGFIGPIFGSVYNNTSYTVQENLNTLWNGNDAANGSNLTMSSYYTSYSANGTSFTSTYTTGNTPENTTYRRNASISSNSFFGTTLNIGYIQGVNKASRLTNESTMLTNFNNYYSDDKIEFLYSDSEFVLKRRLTANVNEVTDFNYQILVDDPYNVGSYTYDWYIDDVLDTSKTNTTLQEIINESFEENIHVKVVVYDGDYYGVVKFDVPRIRVDVAFTLDLSDVTNFKIIASLVGSGTQTKYFDINDYTYEWYKIDISGLNIEKVEGATELTLEHAEDGTEYKLIATNNKYEKLSAEGNIIVGDRNVVYVSYSAGNDSRLGDTPATAVKTLSRAYALLDADVSRARNIIVVMGNYNTNSIYNNATATTYEKNATLTGIYAGIDYDATLYMYGSTSSYRYLCGNTTFQYMDWYGGNNQLYLYIQGYDLTMGEGVTMRSYASANTNQGLIDGSAPAVHIICGWLRYNQATLPRTNAEILIKSGTYGRIILGGSPGTTGASNLQMNTSHNFIGSDLSSDPYNVTVTVDIQNSTTADNYTYDVNLLVGGSACGNIIGNITENIKSGTIGRVLGASIGDSSDYPNGWQYPINTFIGSTTINMTGGTVTELYGGCLGRNMDAIGSGENGTGRICDSYFYGTININISGGRVIDNIYGAGAGGVTGYHANSSDEHKNYGQNISTVVNINVSGGTIESNIYGGGYGFTDYLTRNVIAEDGGALYGNSNIKVSGSPTISGSIYAGGCGYNLTNLPNLAQMYGNSYIELSGSPTISGSIFGGGAGITNLENMAMLIGNSTIKVLCNLSSSVYGGGNIAKAQGTTDIYVESGTHTGEIYGGGNVGALNGDAKVTINGGTNNGNIYGGGNQATANNTVVDINGGVNNNNIFGGGNQATVQTTKVTIDGGTNTNVFAGGNEASVTTSSVEINAGTTQNVYGGGNSAPATTTNVYLQGGTAGTIYGGSNLTGNVTTTNITSTSGTVAEIYGGNNAGGNVEKSIIKIEDGNITNVYGGNNAGGTLNTSEVTILNGTINQVFGGGNQAETTTSNITVESGNISAVYGGGNQAGVTTTNVNLQSGTIGDVFGGSNQSGNVIASNIIANGVASDGGLEGASMTVTYDVRAAESWQTTEYPTYAKLYVTLKNSAVSSIDTWDAEISVADAVLYQNYSNSEIVYENGKFIVDEINRYYGTNALSANGGIYSFEFEIFTNQTVEEFELKYYFAGQDSSGNLYTASNKDPLKVNNVYGGNNAGGVTTNTNVTIQGGEFINVFGGGNQAEVDTPTVNISGGKFENIYGGGNAAAVNNSTSLIIANGSVSNNVYGGGNEGIVENSSNTEITNTEIQGSVFGGGNAAAVNDDTSLIIVGGNIGNNAYGGGNEGVVNGSSNANITDTKIQGSVYGGGNGITAIVLENSTLTLQGNTTVGFEGCDNPTEGCAFAGGNAAATGQDGNGNTSIATINISGAIIYGNVYGGANTAIIYGKTDVNIGKESIDDSTVKIGNIYIKGTIFGGGEANASGSETYDYTFEGVKAGIDMYIDGNGYDSFKVEGSIFGSGNASTSVGTSEIYIKNYGTFEEPQKNISIQRANLVDISNSAITLSGAKDRTNEYSDEFFTLSRIDVLKIKNDTTLYLNYGANLLQNFWSLKEIDGVEELATVTIDEETGQTERNVNNRLYMLEGKNLNIATNEKVTAYGKVYGMTFLGLYTNAMNPSTSTGLYNQTFNNGDYITNEGTFTVNSYVLAEHKENHDTHVDGFYTNINNEGYIKTEYVGVTPESGTYYIWMVGDAIDVTIYDITLTASKYATLGTTELPLTGFSTANTKFVISGFSAGLAEGIELVNPKDIPAIAETEEIANSQFALNMRNGKSGWITDNNNNFYTAEGGKYDGDSLYQTENMDVTPSLILCFYHSQNLSTDQLLGTVKIRFQVLIPVDDLNYEIAIADVNVTLVTDLYPDDFYEAAITPGEEFTLFTTTETNITNDGEFSTYYSLYIPGFSENDLYEDYLTYKRCIVSRNLDNTDYVFKANTRITMLDLASNTTYYYVVSEDDELNKKNIYYLTDFIKMGSTNEKYNPTELYSKYYNASQDLIYENYIFQVNFSEAGITTPAMNNTLLMELQDQDNETLVGVLGIQRDTTKYSIYTGKGATITADVTVSPETAYLGNDINLNVTTNYSQQLVDTKVIYDTKYLNQKVGLKISLFDKDGKQLNSDSLLGLYFELDGQKYYPRIDGTTRIKVADRVSNVLSKIKINTSQNTTIPTGEYTIKIETFGSSDGIYYGLEASDFVETKIYIVNGAYGLKVQTNDGSKIVNKSTGRTQNDENTITANLEYSSALEKPIITVSLYRRDYSDVISTTYNKVDLKDYVLNSLTASSTSKEYILTEEPTENMQTTFILKPGLVTGTYKLVFKLYDGTNYIGEVYEYIIIR